MFTSVSRAQRDGQVPFFSELESFREMVKFLFRCLEHKVHQHVHIYNYQCTELLQGGGKTIIYGYYMKILSY